MPCSPLIIPSAVCMKDIAVLNYFPKKFVTEVWSVADDRYMTYKRCSTPVGGEQGNKPACKGSLTRIKRMESSGVVLHIPKIATMFASH